MNAFEGGSQIKKSVLHYPKFIVLWLGETISLIGDRLLMVVLIAMVYDYTNSSAAVGIMMMLKAIPALVLGTLAGVFADRFPRKWIMVISNIAQGILVLLFPISRSITVIFIIYFLMASINQFFMPARSATIPDLVPSEILMNANSFFALSIIGSMAIGPAIGGWISEAFGSKAAFYTDSFTFFVPAIAVGLMTIPYTRVFEKKIKIGSDIKKGFSCIVRNKPVFDSLVLIASTFITIGTISVLGVAIVRDNMESGSSGFGLIMSLMGLGMLIGSAITIKIAKRINNQVLGSFGACISGIAMVIIPLLSNLGTGMVISFFNGIGLIAVQVTSQTTLLKVDEEIRGRVQGISQTIIGSMTFITSALSGLLAEKIEPQFVIIGSGIITFLIGVITILNHKNPSTEKILSKI